MFVARIDERLERICLVQGELLDELEAIGRTETAAGRDSMQDPDYAAKLQRARELDVELIHLLRAREGD